MDKSKENQPTPPPIVIAAEPAKPEPKPAEPAKVEEKPKDDTKTQIGNSGTLDAKPDVKADVKPVEPAKQPEVAKLYSAETSTYKAWVTQVGDKTYQANLELSTGSAYSWPAQSAQEAEELVKYHVTNQKL